MNLACPSCGTVYRLDPARIPEGGVTTQCRACQTMFRAEQNAEAEVPGAVVAAVEATAPPAAAPVAKQAAAESKPATPGPPRAAHAPPRAAAQRPAGAPAFGPQDPETHAKRLARALVSDIVVYNREKRQESAARGTLRKDFRDEVLKSWEEYVDQVGQEMAQKTPYFRDALNEILAEGKRVF